MGRTLKGPTGPYYCCFCGRALTNNYPCELLRHFKANSCYDKSGSRTGACPVCAKRSGPPRLVEYSKNELIDHLESVHRRARPREAEQVELVPLDDDLPSPFAPGDIGGGSVEEAFEGVDASPCPSLDDQVFETGDSIEFFDSPEVYEAPALPSSLMSEGPPDSDGGEEVDEVELGQLPLADRVVDEYGTKVDYQVRANELLDAVIPMKICLLLLEQKITETTNKAFAELVHIALQRSLFADARGISRVPQSVKRIRTKCRALLSWILNPEMVVATRIGISQPIAFLDPGDIVASWLSLPDVLNALVERNAIDEENFAIGRNPIRESYANGSPPTISEVWHGTEYYDSVSRAHEYWGPRYRLGGNRIFVHLGFFFDSFTVISHRSHSILLLSLMGVSKCLSDRLDLHMPICLFKEEKKADPLECILKTLRPRLESLARGFKFVAKDGQEYVIFCVTSHLYGDIPAIREVVGLKGNNCLYQCPYCLIKAHYEGSNEQCLYKCYSRMVAGLPAEATAREVFGEKDEEMYRHAFLNPELEYSCEEMALGRWSQKNGPQQVQCWGANKQFRHFPGVSIPNSLCTDLMHNEFLGDTKKHLSKLLGLIAETMEIPQEELARRISSKFGEIQLLNRSYVRYDFLHLKDVTFLTAAAAKKLITWSMAIFRLVQVPQDHPSLRQEMKVWESRVETVKLLCKRRLTPEDLQTLTRSLRDLNQSCCITYPRFCTIKTHLMQEHAVEIIKRQGPMPHFWSFRAESKIGRIKRLFVNSNGQSVVETIFGRLALMAAIHRVLEYNSITPLAEYRPRMSPGEYGIFARNSFALARGETFAAVLTIRKIVVSPTSEAALVASAPLFSTRDRNVLLVSGQWTEARQEIPVSDLLPVDLVPFQSGYYQLIGHDVYGMEAMPASLVAFHNPV